MIVDYAAIYSREHKKPGRFPGLSVMPYVATVCSIVEHHKPRSLLDYGCGKGYQYLACRIHERWGGILPYCYDVGIPQLNKKPDYCVDGIICTDVMEHIHPLDVIDVLSDIFDTLNNGGFVFFNISCRPARKKFKGGDMEGQNMHLAIMPPEWWADKVREALIGRNISIYAAFEKSLTDTGPVYIITEDYMDIYQSCVEA